jgi:AbrB family looped-hinge helix DNA binding protein
MRREIWASVTERGQVTIPAEVRRALGLGKRDKVIFSMEDGVTVIRRAKHWREVIGSVPPLKEPKTEEEIDAIVARDVAAAYKEELRQGNA